MNKFKTIISLIICILVSYIFFYYITSEFLTYIYQGSSNLQLPLYFLIYIGQTILIYSFLKYIQNNKASKYQIYALWIIYFIVMILLLFGRTYIGSYINLSLSNLLSFSKQNLLQNTLNLLLFIPIGFLYKNKNIQFTLFSSLILVLSIECLQLITHRGIFDVVDIFLDLFGILIGYYLVKHNIVGKVN